MPFVVLDSSRNIVSLHATQADATAAATADADWSAHTGEVKDDDWKGNARPGWYLTTAGAVAPEKPTTELDTLKSSIKKTQMQMQAWLDAHHANAAGRDPADVITGHKFLYRGLQGLYLVCRNSSMTVANREKFADLTSGGALDIDSVPAFFEKIDSLTNPAPTAPCAWVNLLTLQRVNLNEYSMVAGTPPGASVDLLGDAWVDALTS